MLPEGWVEATLGEVASIRSSKSDPATLSGQPFIGLEHIEAHTSRLLEYGQADDVKSSVATFVAGDVLFGRLRPYLNKVIEAPFDGCASAEVIPFVAQECVDRTLLRRWMMSPDFLAFTASLDQGDRPRVKAEELKSFPVALPPLAEQRRIVAKLDALTARLARARAELDRVPVLAEKMRVTAMKTSFHWDDDPGHLPSGWTQKRIDEVGTVQLGRQRSPKDHSGTHMRPYMRSANITWAGWDLSDVKEMNFSPSEFETFQLKPGDVLLNEGSGSAKEVGKPAVWHGEVEGACFQNTLLRVRPHGFLPELLRYCLLYVAMSGQFIKNTQGVNIIHIGKAGLSKTIIPVPPKEQQAQLLETLNIAFTRADRLEAEAARARALLDRLEAAILARAFRGELVPQDPADEPASILLARIRQSRAAAPQVKRGRKAKAA